MSFATLRSKPGLHEVLGAHFYDAHREELPPELTSRHVEWLFMAVEAARCSDHSGILRAPFRYAWERLLLAGFPVAFREALIRVGVLGILSRLPHIGGLSGNFKADTQPLVDECRQVHANSLLRSDRWLESGRPRPSAAAQAFEIDERRLDIFLVPPVPGNRASSQFGSSSTPVRRTLGTAPPDRELPSLVVNGANAFWEAHRSDLPRAMNAEHAKLVFATAFKVISASYRVSLRTALSRTWFALPQRCFSPTYLRSLRGAGLDSALEELLARCRPPGFEEPQGWDARHERERARDKYRYCGRTPNSPPGGWRAASPGQVRVECDEARLHPRILERNSEQGQLAIPNELWRRHIESRQSRPATAVELAVDASRSLSRALYRAEVREAQQSHQSTDEAHSADAKDAPESRLIHSSDNPTKPELTANVSSEPALPSAKATVEAAFRALTSAWSAQLLPSYYGYPGMGKSKIERLRLAASHPKKEKHDDDEPPEPKPVA